MLREKPDDYDELVQEFTAEANANPVMWQRANEEIDPMRAIYTFMKARKSPPLDEAALRKKHFEEFEAEQKKKASISEAEQTPPSPAGTPGSGESPGAAFKTVDDLFAERRRSRLG
jgi:hypothetical protein